MMPLPAALLWMLVTLVIGVGVGVVACHEILERALRAQDTAREAKRRTRAVLAELEEKIEEAAAAGVIDPDKDGPGV
jgi:hypothetical protein